MENKAAGAIYELPSTHRFDNLAIAVKEVTEQITKCTKLEDALVSCLYSLAYSLRSLTLSNQFISFVIEHLLGYVPIFCLNPLFGYDAPTFLFTNVPGGSQVNILKGCLLEKIVPIAPNCKGIGKLKRG